MSAESNDDAFNELADHFAANNSAAESSQDNVELISALRRLLSPVVCRRLGIYEWPEGFLLSVVIPVYNEAATVAALIKRVRQAGVPCELIVVDDASTDATPEILAALPDQDQLTIVRHAQNQGKGAAIPHRLSQDSWLGRGHSRRRFGVRSERLSLPPAANSRKPCGCGVRKSIQFQRSAGGQILAPNGKSSGHVAVKYVHEFKTDRRRNLLQSDSPGAC